MKKSIWSSILSVILLFVGCKSYTPSMSVPDNDPISIEPLPITYYGMTKIDVKEDPRMVIVRNYIDADINKNIVQSTKQSQGTLEIIEKACSIDRDWYTWWGWHTIPPLQIYAVFSIFGVPISGNEAAISYEFLIKDKYSNIIWHKIYNYKKDILVGLYYGKSKKRLAIDGAKDIMKQFKEDYKNDYSFIYAQLKNPKNADQLAQLPPSHVNIIFDKETKFPNYAERIKDERFFVEIDGKYIGNIGFGEYVRISFVPQKIYSIKIYVNNKYQSEGNISYYEDYDVVKAAKTCIYSSNHTLLLNEDVNLRIKRSNYGFEYQCTEWNQLSSVELAYLKKAQTYDFRKKNQPLLQAGREPRTNVAKQNNVDKQVEKENTNYQPKQVTTIIPAILSDVDKNIYQSSTKSTDTYVLIIANEKYSYIDPVSYAENDGQIFKEYCKQTLGVPERQIFTYTNATFGNISDGIDKLKYCLNNFPNAKAIVYYCGHGIPDEKTGHAYLIPVDGKGTNMTTCYSLDKLYKTLAATKAQSITYFMDACFTGANKEGSMLVAARGVARAPEKEVLSGKTIVFSASSGDETAMTLEEQRHGLFTYYLLKKLQETEGNVTYGELADYIHRNVKKDAFLINEKPQTPVVATSPAVVNTWKTMKLK